MEILQIEQGKNIVMWDPKTLVECSEKELELLKAILSKLKVHRATLDKEDRLIVR